MFQPIDESDRKIVEAEENKQYKARHACLRRFYFRQFFGFGLLDQKSSSVIFFFGASILIQNMESLIIAFYRLPQFKKISL